ncbi:MAG TPA: hybrid sensor histidine kinase/response regulator [Candidatus Atribacteria bacterium]|nr:hybrid sensor histidine kinase/response regulator [Candidatus Atribacteria bacterium]
MIELGKILIRDNVSLIEARNKIRLLGQDLKYSSMSIIRLATITSEIIRSLGPTKKEEVHIIAGFEKKENKYGLVLQFQSKKKEINLSLIRTFFDEVQIIPLKDGLQRIITFKYIPDSTFKLTEEFVQKEKERILRLSRAELLSEVKKKNEELLKFLDELKKAKKEAESASRTKSIFLASMSHEIRTPMNAIVGMTELLASTPLNDEQKEYLEMLQISANSLLDIINNVLDISKIEAGELELEKTEVDLRQVVEAVGITLGAKAAQKGLELLCHVEPDVPNYIIGDPTRLRQILINLVGNSLKFTEKGEVALSVEKVKSEDDKIDLLFKVRDTGIGIPKEKQNKIFESFTQVDTATTRKYGGTGLGLNISKQLVELMGGKIWVESEVGKGSVFKFTASYTVVKKAGEIEVIHPEIKGLKVLIIDDNATNRLIVRKTLLSWDALPAEVEGGFSALKELELARGKGSPYQLILTDKNMPEMDGFEVTRKIRELPGYEKIPVVMLSSDKGAGDVQRGKDLGMADFILKPVRRSRLYSAILKAIESGRKEKVKVTEKAGAGFFFKGKPLKILLAEDNIINQKLGVRLLEKQGCQTVVANNGREAVELVQKDGFDLVLMDLQMPEMDGIEATKEIRKREKETGRHIPIIALTANAFEEDRRRCLESGMDEYATKPIKIKELFIMIDKILKNK